MLVNVFIFFLFKAVFIEKYIPCLDPEGEGGGGKGSGPQLKNHKNIRFLSNIGPDP